MTVNDIHLVYFSAAFTVKKTVTEMASAFGVKTTVHDITCGAPAEDLVLNEKDLLIIEQYARRNAEDTKDCSTV